MQAWYLIMTKPKQDALAEQNLLNQGYQVYRPRVRVKKQKRGKLVASIESLFPRYLFIELCDQSQNWAPIRSTLGVANLVRFGCEPAKVDSAVIAMIKDNEVNASEQLVELDGFKLGEALQVNQGPFIGLEVKLQSFDSEQRIMALIELLGKAQILAFDLAEVAKK